MFLLHYITLHYWSGWLLHVKDHLLHAKASLRDILLSYTYEIPQTAKLPRHYWIGSVIGTPPSETAATPDASSTNRIPE